MRRDTGRRVTQREDRYGGLLITTHKLKRTHTESQTSTLTPKLKSPPPVASSTSAATASTIARQQTTTSSPPHTNQTHLLAPPPLGRLRRSQLSPRVTRPRLIRATLLLLLIALLPNRLHRRPRNLPRPRPTARPRPANAVPRLTRIRNEHLPMLLLLLLLTGAPLRRLLLRELLRRRHFRRIQRGHVKVLPAEIELVLAPIPALQSNTVPILLLARRVKQRDRGRPPGRARGGGVGGRGGRAAAVAAAVLEKGGAALAAGLVGGAGTGRGGAVGVKGGGGDHKVGLVKVGAELDQERLPAVGEGDVKRGSDRVGEDDDGLPSVQAVSKYSSYGSDPIGLATDPEFLE